jgi:hypothetical protein
MNAIIVAISSLVQTSPDRLEISEGVPGSIDSYLRLVDIKNQTYIFYLPIYRRRLNN